MKSKITLSPLMRATPPGQHYPARPVVQRPGRQSLPTRQNSPLPHPPPVGWAEGTSAFSDRPLRALGCGAVKNRSQVVYHPLAPPQLEGTSVLAAQASQEPLPPHSLAHPALLVLFLLLPLLPCPSLPFLLSLFIPCLLPAPQNLPVALRVKQTIHSPE